MTSPSSKRQEVLADALTAIDGARGADYGSPQENWTRIAAMWSAILRVPITPTQTGLCMIAVKLSRLANTPAHEDSWVDVAGYAALGAEVSGG